jgi:hypothetical protein
VEVSHIFPLPVPKRGSHHPQSSAKVRRSIRFHKRGINLALQLVDPLRVEATVPSKVVPEASTLTSQLNQPS